MDRRRTTNTFTIYKVYTTLVSYITNYTVQHMQQNTTKGAT